MKMFTHHSSNVGRIVQCDDSLEILRKVGSPRGQTLRKGHVLGRVSVSNMVHKWKHIAREGLAVSGNAANADTC